MAPMMPPSLRGQGAHVAMFVIPAGGDHGNVTGLGDIEGGLDVHALHHAVAGDIRVHDGADTLAGKALARSVAFSADTSAQPSVATRPSRASRPTMMRSGKGAAGLGHEARLRTAWVPMMA
jgi:hypothetical protein